MDALHTESHKQDKYILKNNLWKFIKALRAQANPIYCLLVASPIHYAWITILDRQDAAIQKRISVAQFVHNFKKMPSERKRYQLGINLCEEDAQGVHKRTFEAHHLHELSVEAVRPLLPALMAFHFVEAMKRGEPFELTPQTIAHYKFKTRYLEELQSIVETLKNKHL